MATDINIGKVGLMGGHGLGKKVIFAAAALLSVGACTQYPAPGDYANMADAQNTAEQMQSGSEEKSDAIETVLNETFSIDRSDGFPQWAFPGPLVKSIPGSDTKYSDVQMYDRTGAVDWYPMSHPTMPDVVKGRPPMFACGFCHLPQGAGRSENAALAGLPEKYIIEQLADFKAGRRKTPDPKFGAAKNMELTAAQASDVDIAAAAKYYASLKFSKHLNLVEGDTVPAFHSDAFVYVFDKDRKGQPLGDRIIEGPDNFQLFEMRDPNMTFTAYVPRGAILRGAALAKGDGGARPPCSSCHGDRLTGTEIAPPIAGHLPTGVFRELYAFRTGARAGTNSAAMKQVTGSLNNKQMIDLAAYVASLNP